MFLSSLSIWIRDLIFVCGLGPCLLIAFLVEDPTIETLLFTLGQGDWLLSGNWKYWTCHVILFFTLFLLFLHAYTACLTFVIYCDLTHHFLLFICESIQAKRPHSIVSEKLPSIWATFIYQKLLNLIIWDLIQLSCLYYIMVVWPIFILLLYICFRFYSVLPFYIYILITLLALIACVLWAIMHILSSGPYERSAMFLKAGIRLCELERYVYWKLKFRSSKSLKVGAFWWYFRFQNMLATLSEFLRATITLLLL